MGSAASALPLTVQQEAFQLVENVRNNVNRVEALARLWELSDEGSYKVPLCDPQLHLLEELEKILSSATSDVSQLDNACGILWYLSRDNHAKPLICSAELRLVPTMINLLRDQSRSGDFKISLTKALSNCSLNRATHAVLLLPEYGYLKLLADAVMYFAPSEAQFYQSIYCIVSELSNERVEGILQLNLHQHMLNVLIAQGSDPYRWQNRWNGQVYWCLNFIVSLSTLKKGSQAIKQLHEKKFFMELVKADLIEGVKAALILANVYGEEEGSSQTTALLESYPKVLPVLIRLFNVTLNFSQVPSSEIDSLTSIGFAFGIVQLQEITHALKILSISDRNKAIMIQNESLLPLILKTIQLFLMNAPPCSDHGVERGQYIENFAGGGGEDTETLINALELLSQLSFYYEEDQVLQQKWRKIENTFEPKVMMEELLSLPTERLPYEAKQFALTLLNRLTQTQPPLSIPPETNKNTTTPSGHSNGVAQQRQHIMLSYSWANNKQLVIALGQRLREMGYDVWRDEEGSSLVPAMSGDIVETMAEAIQSSYLVIICVSPEYKESVNCRAEAKYARAREGSNHLRLAYVMMDEQYHTKSSPRVVDGWLGFMLGTELWYPLWHETKIESTAIALSHLIGENAKRDENVQMTAAMVNLTSSPPFSKPTNPGSSPVIVGEGGHTVASSSSAPPDVETAWKYLDVRKAQFPKSLTTLLDELGVTEAADLEHLEKEHLTLLAGMLKVAPQNQFRKSMRLKG